MVLVFGLLEWYTVTPGSTGADEQADEQAENPVLDWGPENGNMLCTAPANK